MIRDYESKRKKELLNTVYSSAISLTAKSGRAQIDSDGPLLLLSLSLSGQKRVSSVLIRIDKMILHAISSSHHVFEALLMTTDVFRASQRDSFSIPYINGMNGKVICKYSIFWFLFNSASFDEIRPNQLSYRLFFIRLILPQTHSLSYFIFF